MGKFFAVLFSFVLAGAIVFGIPYYFPEKNSEIKASFTVEKSIVSQEVVEYSKERQLYHKIYHNGNLIGVISNYDNFNSKIDEEYKSYEEEFPNSQLCLGKGIYVIDENTYSRFENVDDQIFDYLKENKCFGIKTTMVEFSTSEGVYEIIYVKNENDFYEARDQFLINFIDESSLNSLRNNEEIASPSFFGSVDTNLRISETITLSEAVTSPDEVFASTQEIYDFLCYGRNTEKTYYVTEAGDTLQGVGYYFQDMSAKQIMMLNPDIIHSTDQMLTEGMVLNVTYFQSPITVLVTKERLAQEIVIPDSPEYRNDASLVVGTVNVVKEEVNGVSNILYEEEWVNGVLQSGTVKSTYVVKEAERGIIAVGTTRAPSIGTGNWGWPVENPAISCLWGGYPGHTGTDVINRYERYGSIIASDTGVVERVGYDSVSGNFIIINHNNGYKSYYGHASLVYVKAGDIVSRGERIGRIGMTGVATGPHVHFRFEKAGQKVDACSLMDCNSIRN